MGEIRENKKYLLVLPHRKEQIQVIVGNVLNLTFYFMKEGISSKVQAQEDQSRKIRTLYPGLILLVSLGHLKALPCLHIQLSDTDVSLRQGRRAENFASEENIYCPIV